jgi:hypothetical protein
MMRVLIDVTDSDVQYVCIDIGAFHDMEAISYCGRENLYNSNSPIIELTDTPIKFLSGDALKQPEPEPAPAEAEDVPQPETVQETANLETS